MKTDAALQKVEFAEYFSKGIQFKNIYSENSTEKRDEERMEDKCPCEQLIFLLTILCQISVVVPILEGALGLHSFSL